MNWSMDKLLNFTGQYIRITGPKGIYMRQH